MISFFPFFLFERSAFRCQIAGKIRRADDDIVSFTGFSLDATVFEYDGERYYIRSDKLIIASERVVLSTPAPSPTVYAGPTMQP